MSDIFVDNITLSDFLRKLGYIWHGGLESLPTEKHLSALGLQKCRIKKLQSLEPPCKFYEIEVLVGCAIFIVLDFPQITETNVNFITKDLSKEYVWFMVKRNKSNYAEIVHDWCKRQKIRVRKKYFDVENGNPTDVDKQKYLTRHSYYSTLQMLVCSYLNKDNNPAQNATNPQSTSME